MTWEIQWVAGPDAGATMLLEPGRWIVGRAPQAHIRCADPALEPFHVELSLWPHGLVDIRQLAGRHPIRHDRDQIKLGTSALRIEHTADRRVSAAAESAVDTTVVDPSITVEPRTVVRAARAVPRWDPPRLPPQPEQPAAPPNASNAAGLLVPAAAGALVSVAFAMLIGQPVFALFGLVALVGPGTMWMVDHRRRQRERVAALAAFARAISSYDEALDAERQAFARHRRAVATTLASTVRALDADPPSIWQRRGANDDAFRVSVGSGTMRWTSSDGARTEVLDDLPVEIDLGPGARVAVIGPHAADLARGLLIQLAVAVGPADWQLHVHPADHPAERWWWTLPHHSADASQADHHTLVVTDRIAEAAERSSALRRRLQMRPSDALLVVDHDAVAAPACCTTVVTTMSDGSARVDLDTHDDQPPARASFTGLSGPAAARHAQRLAAFRDPEDAVDGGCPTEASFDDVIAIAPTVDDIIDRWDNAGADAAPRTPIAVGSDGVVDVDLVRDGPHTLIAGTTGSGKSELLRSLIIGLAVNAGPEQLAFVLIDYKGGSAFDGCADLPHVAGVVTDLDAGMAERVLRSLRVELAARERLLRDHGAPDLPALRAMVGAPVVPRLVVVVDEFAALALEHPDVLRSLIGVAQRGRSLGLHLVLATQRPGGVVSDDIRTNTDLRIALRVHDVSEAMDIVGDPVAAGLSRATPGRAVIRRANEPVVVVQAARCGSVGEWAAAIADAARRSGRLRARRPWSDPLPRSITVDDVAPGAIGWVDRPDEQRHDALQWVPGDGDLLVVGAPGSGVTTTLRALAARVCGGDSARDLIVIDAVGDASWDAIAGHDACAAVVRLSERERLLRALRTAAQAVRPTVLVIDGFATLRTELEPIGREPERAALERLLADVVPDLTLIIGADRASGVPPSLAARCAQRWLLHVHDAHDGASLGVPASAVPPKVPGRLVIAPGLLDAQVAVGVEARPSAHRARRLATLPDLVRRIELPPARHHGTTWIAPIGIGFDDLAPVELAVHPGEHIVVLGPSRSGRSTALAALRQAWLDAHPSGRTLAIAPLDRAHDDPTDLDAALPDVIDQIERANPTLLVVDDAELTDDPGGVVTRLVERRTPHLTVIVAARPDAVRGAYGHWTTAVRRSRLGIVMAAGSDLDGDLLGAAIPRHLPIAPRPGLAWVSAHGQVLLAQLAALS
jgi:DNA segregation ATPase FtsK/SpoIIIE, S-DNA-T family